MAVAVMKLLYAAVVWWFIVSGGEAAGHVGPQISHLPRQTNGKNAGTVNETMPEVLPCPNVLNTCPTNFVMLENRRCYYFSCTTETWQDALTACRQMDATLAYPLNAVEEVILGNYLSFFEGPKYWWLGGTDQGHPLNFIWAHTNAPIKYTDWAPGQPDNSNNNEFCLHYRDIGDGNGWKWNDMICGNLYRYICQPCDTCTQV